MKKYETTIDYQATKELTRGNMILYQLMALVGVLLVLTFSLLGVFADAFTAFWNILILILGIVFIFFGFAYTFFIMRTRNRAKEVHMVMQYEFNDTFLVIKAKTGENTKTLKVPYSDIRFYKESPNYIFLYVSITNAFPLLKGPELEQIKKIIHFDNIRKRFI